MGVSKMINRREIVLNEMLNFFKEVNWKPKSILDVGCGDDYFRDKLNEHGIGWIGMDIKSCTSIQIKGTMEDIPMWDGTINLILSSHSFEHTVNPIQTIKEFWRVLQQSGILFLVTPYYCTAQLVSSDITHNFVLTDMQIICLLEKYRFKIHKFYTLKPTEDSEEKDWQYIIIASKV